MSRRLLVVVGLSLALVVSSAATAQDDVDRAAELLASGDYQGAFDLADGALERADDPRAHLVLAAASTKLGRFAKARTHLEIARELAPDLADLDYQFGVLEQTRGDEARAEGKTKRASKRYLEAVASFDRELRTAPEHLGALEAKAICLIYAQEDDRAIAALERWVEVDPGSTEASVHLAGLRADRGSVDDPATKPTPPPPTAVPASPEPTPRSEAPAPTQTAAPSAESAVPVVPASPAPATPDAISSEPAAPGVPTPGAAPPPAESMPEASPERSGPPSPGIPAYATVRALYLEGNHEDAHDLLEQLRAELGDNWRTQGLVALDYLGREQPVEASDALAAFLEMDPPDDEVRAIAQAYAVLYRELQRSWAAAEASDATLPEVSLRVQVLYPKDAERLNVSAKVDLLLRVEKDGSVGESRIYAVTISHNPSFHLREFERATREAVAQWEYRPATRNGEPVVQLVPVSIDFTPAGHRKKPKKKQK